LEYNQHISTCHIPAAQVHDEDTFYQELNNSDKTYVAVGK